MSGGTGIQIYAARMALQYLMEFGVVIWMGWLCLSSNLTPKLYDPPRLVSLP